MPKLNPKILSIIMFSGFLLVGSIVILWNSSPSLFLESSINPSDEIADHQSQIQKIEDDGTFEVRGAIVINDKIVPGTIRGKLRGLPTLGKNETDLLRSWIKSKYDTEYISCALFDDGTIDILALELNGKKIIHLNKEAILLLKKSVESPPLIPPLDF